MVAPDVYRRIERLLRVVFGKAARGGSTSRQGSVDESWVARRRWPASFVAVAVAPRGERRGAEARPAKLSVSRRSASRRRAPAGRTFKLAVRVANAKPRPRRAGHVSPAPVLRQQARGRRS